MNAATRIAENHIQISRALFNEGMRAVENKEYTKSVRKIALFTVILLAAAAAWLLYTGGSLIFLLGETIFLGAMLSWLIIMLPGTRRRKKYQAMTHGSDDVPERTTVFYQEYLSVTAENGKETIIPYCDITGWQETKNLYLLNCKNNICVMLDKKGFQYLKPDTPPYIMKEKEGGASFATICKTSHRH